MNCNKTQIENEVEGDKTEESENSGKAITNLIKRVTISRKQSLKFLLRVKLTHTSPHVPQYRIVNII